jgi:hypothetical protein
MGGTLMVRNGLPMLLCDRTDAAIRGTISLRDTQHP